MVGSCGKGQFHWKEANGGRHCKSSQDSSHAFFNNCTWNKHKTWVTTFHWCFLRQIEDGGRAGIRASVTTRQQPAKEEALCPPGSHPASHSRCLFYWGLPSTVHCHSTSQSLVGDKPSKPFTIQSSDYTLQVILTVCSV